MTSLFSRLQKLNKEATPPEWEAKDARLAGHNWIAAGHSWVAPYPLRERDAALIVECRNSLPAVLNLIEAALPVSEWDELPDYEYLPELCAELLQQLGVLREAVAVFVSGQEEPK